MKLNPLELAIQTVESKSKDLRTLTGDVESNPNQSINPLSMLLKGVIDAAVMGGISNYDKVHCRQLHVGRGVGVATGGCGHKLVAFLDKKF